MQLTKAEKTSDTMATPGKIAKFGPTGNVIDSIITETDAQSDSVVGVFGATNSGPFAGFCRGAVQVVGTLSKSGGWLPYRPSAGLGKQVHEPLLRRVARNEKCLRRGRRHGRQRRGCRNASGLV